MTVPIIEPDRTEEAAWLRGRIASLKGAVDAAIVALDEDAAAAAHAALIEAEHRLRGIGGEYSSVE